MQIINFQRLIINSCSKLLSISEDNSKMSLRCEYHSPIFHSHHVFKLFPTLHISTTSRRGAFSPSNAPTWYSNHFHWDSVYIVAVDNVCRCRYQLPINIIKRYQLWYRNVSVVGKTISISYRLFSTLSRSIAICLQAYKHSNCRTMLVSDNSLSVY